MNLHNYLVKQAEVNRLRQISYYNADYYQMNKVGGVGQSRQWFPAVPRQNSVNET